MGAADTRLWTHVAALRPLGKAHMTGPLLAWLGILVLTGAWLVRSPKPSAFEELAAAELLAEDAAEELTALDAPTPPKPLRVVAIALAGLLLAFLLSAVLPLVSAPSGMLTMLAIGLWPPSPRSFSSFRGRLTLPRARGLAGGVRSPRPSAPRVFALVHAPQAAFGALALVRQHRLRGARVLASAGSPAPRWPASLRTSAANGVIALPVVYALLLRG
ncbi:MAG: hypothetical protein IPG81_25365 [Sandaracinaceae bacterium]|nr:hypothetical protein [Sandaracinaceae bacterium]